MPEMAATARINKTMWNFFICPCVTYGKGIAKTGTNEGVHLHFTQSIRHFSQNNKVRPEA